MKGRQTRLRRSGGLVVLGGGGRVAGKMAAPSGWSGAGPGDPELLTLKALRVLQGADVVVPDGLVSEEILDLAPQSARLISVASASRAIPTARTRSTACSWLSLWRA